MCGGAGGHLYACETIVLPVIPTLLMPYRITGFIRDLLATFVRRFERCRRINTDDSAQHHRMEFTAGLSERKVHREIQKSTLLSCRASLPGRT
ncbi:hypothetical protein KCP77_23300 [Salmonella enterica subsp. enterica]|nr:hypothetical protein KCP77_23300 [Salmonella enterica subsp. enterica]